MESKENKLNGGFDYKESYLSPEEQAALNALRRVQLERPFSEEERQKFLELSKKEEERKRKGSGLTEEEGVEYLQLTREQIKSENWTPEKAARLLELQKKL